MSKFETFPCVLGWRLKWTAVLGHDIQCFVLHNCWNLARMMKCLLLLLVLLPLLLLLLLLDPTCIDTPGAAAHMLVRT